MVSKKQATIPKAGQPLLYTYTYDQLNRLTKMFTYNGLNPATNNWSVSAINDYREQVSYDANGNIVSYKRNGDAARANSSGTGMDNLAYTYKPGTNQLDKVVDAAPDAAAGEYDKYNDIKQGQTDGNYQYDSIGNLISDASEGITSIAWNVYGKIKSVAKTSGVNISFGYDASGNRIMKNVNGKESWYVRDASDNVVSIYTVDPAINSGHLTQAGIDLYGGSRLGIWNLSRDVSALTSVDYSNLKNTTERGDKLFELNNQLENVLATISDKKIQHSTDGISIDYYTPEVISANDYYPGGMLTPGRKFSSEIGYRYGFNGKEKDNEIKGEGNSYNFDARMYDPRVVRWYSTDAKEKPHLSPYNFVQNNFPNKIDPDGKDDIHFHFITHAYTTTYGIGVNQRSFTRYVNTAEIEIIKTNGPDRFFNHKTFISANGMKDKVTEFYPFKESSRSGLTTTPMPFTAGLLKRDDRDIHTLAKYYDASPAFRKYLDTRMKSGDNDFYTSGNWANYKNKFFPARASFNFWGDVSSTSETAANLGMLAEGGLSIFSSGRKAAEEVTDLVGFRKTHILNRHRFGSEIAGKTEFPSTWSDDKIINEINKIANNPNSPGGMGKWDSPYKTGVSDGVEIRVDFYPTNHPKYSGKVSTGYPINSNPNP